MQGVPSKVFAACAGLSGLAIAIIAGLAAGNPADVILLRALIAAAACNVVGYVVGAMCERVMADGLSAYQAQAVRISEREKAAEKGGVRAPAAVS